MHHVTRELLDLQQLKKLVAYGQHARAGSHRRLKYIQAEYVGCDNVPQHFFARAKIVMKRAGEAPGVLYVVGCSNHRADFDPRANEARNLILELIRALGCAVAYFALHYGESGRLDFHLILLNTRADSAGAAWPNLRVARDAIRIALREATLGLNQRRLAENPPRLSIANVRPDGTVYFLSDLVAAEAAAGAESASEEEAAAALLQERAAFSFMQEAGELLAESPPDEGSDVLRALWGPHWAVPHRTRKGRLKETLIAIAALQQAGADERPGLLRECVELFAGKAWSFSTPNAEQERKRQRGGESPPREELAADLALLRQWRENRQVRQAESDPPAKPSPEVLERAPVLPADPSPVLAGEAGQADPGGAVRGVEPDPRGAGLLPPAVAVSTHPSPPAPVPEPIRPAVPYRSLMEACNGNVVDWPMAEAWYDHLTEHLAAETDDDKLDRMEQEYHRFMRRSGHSPWTNQDEARGFLERVKKFDPVYLIRWRRGELRSPSLPGSTAAGAGGTQPARGSDPSLAAAATSPAPVRVEAAEYFANRPAQQWGEQDRMEVHQHLQDLAESRYFEQHTREERRRVFLGIRGAFAQFGFSTGRPEFRRAYLPFLRVLAREALILEFADVALRWLNQGAAYGGRPNEGADGEPAGPDWKGLIGRAWEGAAGLHRDVAGRLALVETYRELAAWNDVAEALESACNWNEGQGVNVDDLDREKRDRLARMADNREGARRFMAQISLHRDDFRYFARGVATAPPLPAPAVPSGVGAATGLAEGIQFAAVALAPQGGVTEKPTESVAVEEEGREEGAEAPPSSGSVSLSPTVSQAPVCETDTVPTSAPANEGDSTASSAVGDASGVTAAAVRENGAGQNHPSSEALFRPGSPAGVTDVKEAAPREVSEGPQPETALATSVVIGSTPAGALALGRSGNEAAELAEPECEGRKVPPTAAATGEPRPTEAAAMEPAVPLQPEVSAAGQAVTGGRSVPVPAGNFEPGPKAPAALAVSESESAPPPPEVALEQVSLEQLMPRGTAGDLEVNWRLALAWARSSQSIITSITSPDQLTHLKWRVGKFYNEAYKRRFDDKAAWNELDRLLRPNVFEAAVDNQLSRLKAANEEKAGSGTVQGEAQEAGREVTGSRMVEVPRPTPGMVPPDAAPAGPGAAPVKEEAARELNVPAEITPPLVVAGQGWSVGGSTALKLPAAAEVGGSGGAVQPVESAPPPQTSPAAPVTGGRGGRVPEEMPSAVVKPAAATPERGATETEARSGTGVAIGRVGAPGSAISGAGVPARGDPLRPEAQGGQSGPAQKPAESAPQTLVGLAPAAATASQSPLPKPANRPLPVDPKPREEGQKESGTDLSGGGTQSRPPMGAKTMAPGAGAAPAASAPAAGAVSRDSVVPSSGGTRAIAPVTRAAKPPATPAPGAPARATPVTKEAEENEWAEFVRSRPRPPEWDYAAKWLDELRTSERLWENGRMRQTVFSALKALLPVAKPLVEQDSRLKRFSSAFDAFVKELETRGLSQEYDEVSPVDWQGIEMAEKDRLTTAQKKTLAAGLASIEGLHCDLHSSRGKTQKWKEACARLEQLVVGAETIPDELPALRSRQVGDENWTPQDRDRLVYCEELNELAKTLVREYRMLIQARDQARDVDEPEVRGLGPDR